MKTRVVGKKKHVPNVNITKKSGVVQVIGNIKKR